jgi:phosphohistidine phosphatase
MEFYVLRHAIAVPHGRPGYDRDSDRPLTPKGARKMRRIARGLASIPLKLDLVLSSPFPRARQTAEIVCEALDVGKKLVLTESLAVGGDPRLLIEEINGRYAAARRVMIVGHEPYLSELISVLLSGTASMNITMKKGGLCKLRIDLLHYDRCAELEWLLTPAIMARLG